MVLKLSRDFAIFLLSVLIELLSVLTEFKWLFLTIFWLESTISWLKLTSTDSDWTDEYSNYLEWLLKDRLSKFNWITRSISLCNSDSFFLLSDRRSYLVDVVDVDVIDVNEETSTSFLTLDERGLSYSVEEDRRILSDIVSSINIRTASILFSISISTISIQY